MKLKNLACALLACAAITPAFAVEGPTPHGIPALRHVWVIMMENHAYAQIIGNPQAPFINAEAGIGNLATNYFAVAHPSLTNYLEMNGGSNFGVQDDNSPDWHDSTCQPNLATGVTNDEAVSSAICPIAGSGVDAATPAIDYTNETSGAPGLLNIDGVKSYAAATNITGITIADQLADYGLSWKSYQENLPIAGADGVSTSDGFFTDTTNFSSFDPSLGLSDSAEVGLYAAKHNPFVYFASVQAGTTPGLSLANSVDFNRLYGDLQSGNVPAYSFIAPNQCDDQHGRGNGTVFCNYDPNDNGTQTGLNPALTMMADQTAQRLVTAIKASPAWKQGRNAIVMLWDENDYSIAPTLNKVVTIVDTNYGSHGKHSATYYTHFSLLATIESGFGLPCLNHACDKSSTVMNDLFH